MNSLVFHPRLMNKLCGLTLLVFGWGGLLSGQSVPTLHIPYTLSEIEAAIASGTSEAIYYSDLIQFTTLPDGSVDESTLTERVPTDFRVDDLDYVLSLRTNPFAEANQLVDQHLECRVSYRLIYFSEATGLDSTDLRSLTVEYDAAAGTAYQAKAYHRLGAFPYVRLRLLSVTLLDQATGSPVSDLSAFDDVFELRQNLQQSRTYRPDPLQAPATPFVRLSDNGGHIEFSWKSVPWAKAYEVEYLFADAFPRESGPALPPEQVGYDFRKNSTRVEVPTQGAGVQNYRFPNIFELGYVVCRVRAIGYWGTAPEQRIAGAWTIPESGDRLTGPIPMSSSFIGLTTPSDVHEELAMNWRHRAVFAGGGRRNDEITYFDGTLRQRQISTSLSADTTILTAEHLYDHAGRKALTFLPAPHRPGAVADDPPVFGYYPAFNRDANGTLIRPEDFEQAPLDCATPNPVSGPAVDETTGAGQYYAPSNPDRTGFQGYVPDAEGYPYMHQEYTADPTGRLRREGQFGLPYRLGSGHEKRYYYATSSQTELDRVFGSDAGLAQHIRKEITVDANGQARAIYRDPRGAIIAESLVGEGPSALDTLAGRFTQQITVDLLAAAGSRTADGTGLSHARHLYISGSPGTQASVELEYHLGQSSYVDDLCAEVCYTCVYEVRIQVQQDCGTMALDTTLLIGNLGELLSCDAFTFSFTENLQLVPGAYTFSTELRVSEQAIAQAVAHYAENCIDITVPLDTPGTCEPPPCVACPPLEFRYVDYGDAVFSDQSGNSVTFPVLFPVRTDPNCTPFCPDRAPDRLETMLITLLADVSPGGQYGKYLDTSRVSDDNPLGVADPSIFPLSVFNTRTPFTAGAGEVANQLPLMNAHWRNPAGGLYRNEDGSPALLPVPLQEDGSLDDSYYLGSITPQVIDGVAYVRPQDLNRVTDFIAAWQPSWAYALVVYHPEYAYYLYSRQYYSSFTLERDLQQTETYAEAASLFPSLTDVDFANDFATDPFLASQPAVRLAYQDRAAVYINREETDPDLPQDFSLVEAAASVIHCGHPRFSPAEVVTCVGANPLFASANPEVRDAEWQTYRAMALDVREVVFQQFRQEWVDANGFFSNEEIGTPAEPLYEDKDKRFPTQNDLQTFFPDESGADFTDDPLVFQQYHEYRKNQSCANCFGADGLLALLNALLEKGRATQNNILPDPPGISLPEALADELGLTSSAPVFWNVVNVSDYFLEVELVAEGMERARLILESDLLFLNDLIVLTCARTLNDNEIGPDGYNFLATGLNRQSDTTAIRGFIDGIDFNCGPPPIPCRQAAFADDMRYFIDYMFENDLLKETDYSLYSFFPRDPITPAMGALLAASNIFEWRWRFTGIGAGFVNVDWYFRNSMGLEITLPVTITANDPSLDLTENLRVVGIGKRDSDSGSGPFYSFQLFLEDDRGGLFTADVNVGIINLFEVITCAPLPPNPALDGSLCCVIPQRAVPGPNCTSILNEIAAGNRDLEIERERAILIDRFRSRYVAHCLDAAQNFVADYTEKMYQHTLFYRDQAGNLVRSIPPAGVDYLTDAEVASTESDRASGIWAPPLTEHQLAAEYRYNSLNQPVFTDQPDEGPVTYVYDELGRSVFRQHAVLAAAEQTEYQRYDALGRLREKGTVTLTGGLDPGFQNYSDLDHQIATGVRTEITSIQYDNALHPLDSAFGRQPRRLRDRVAARYFREEDGGDYDHATHYGYDILGNVQTVVQDFAYLNRNYPLSAGCATETLRIPAGTLEDGVYQTTGDLVVDQTVLVPEGSEVVFRSEAGIRLTAGTYNYHFRAEIAPCTTAVGSAPHAAHLKSIQYTYDLFSGRLLKSRYQPGAEDEWIHYFDYDADNRLKEVRTARFADEPFDLREVEARYLYYRHGQLARMELGTERVQGLDFVYTINGQRKGMNSATLFPERDIGKDGLTGGVHARFARDAYGYALGYFEGDYRSIASIPEAEQFYPQTDVALSGTEYPELFGGYIRYITQGQSGLMNPPVQLHAFRYDQLYRLTGSQLLRNPDVAGNTFAGDAFGPALSSTYGYDANGNLTSLERYDAAGNRLDRLTYHYTPNTNQLAYIDDAEVTEYPLDLEDQAPGNYQYDAHGRLIRDQAAGLSELHWMSNSRLKQIVRDGHSLTFRYDANGQRVFKQGLQSSSYYVRDHIGQILAVYDLKDGQTTWRYSPLYGSRRLGTANPGLILEGAIADTLTQHRGQRNYTLVNHIGNVQTVVSDRKVPQVDGFVADVVSAADYYPFGMLMPGRNLEADGYDYGFQGMEKDDEIKGLGNAYTTEFRQYDPRAGRWLSTDKVYKAYESPYSAFANNPSNVLDPNGLDTVLTEEQYREEYDAIVEEESRSNFSFSRKRLELEQRIEAFNRTISDYRSRYGPHAVNNPQDLVLIIRSVEGESFQREAEDILALTNELERTVRERLREKFGEITVVSIDQQTFEDNRMQYWLSLSDNGFRELSVPRISNAPNNWRDHLDNQPPPTLREQILSQGQFMASNPFGNLSYSISRMSGVDPERAMNTAQAIGILWDITSFRY
mgnify:CR=1 FL=1